MEDIENAEISDLPQKTEALKSDEKEKTDTEQKSKKKLPLVVRILRGVLIFLLTIIVVLLAWIAFCTFVGKKNTISHIPENFTIVVHTDSVYESLSPIINLRAADTLLAESSFASYRGIFMQARSLLSETSNGIKSVLSRKGEIALYEDNKFMVVLDLSYLSSITRFANPLGKFISSKINDLEFNEAEKEFVYLLGDSKFFIRTEKNLVVIASDEKLFKLSYESFENKNLENALAEKKSSEIKIIANAKKAADIFLEGNDTAQKIIPFIKDNALTSIAFSITNDDIDVALNFPINLENNDSELAKILKQKSTSPLIFSRLSDITQYYTLINLCSLESLISVATELMPERNIPSLWSKADGASKALLSISLNDLLFSWSGKEVAVLGLEENSAPVFAFQIQDEKKLREVLVRLDKSFLINANTSLIIGGMRLPCLELPPIFAALISAFGVTIPRPYYLVQNGFIYFSESPQNLSAIFSRGKNNATLAKNISWRNVSKKIDSSSSLSIYYDLKRSLPFFIDGDSALSKILSLYNLGRADVRILESEIALHLHAISSPETSSRLLAGFPIKTGRVQEFYLEESNDVVFWLEDGKIKSLDLQNFEQSEFLVSEKYYISAAENGKLWAATESGNIYLFDKKFSPEKSFPIVTGLRFSGKGLTVGKNFVLVDNEGSLIFVDENGSFSENETIASSSLRLSSNVTEDGTLAIYHRGFEGEIYLYEKSAGLVSLDPMIVSGVGFNSPSVSSINKEIYTAFVTQAGTFYLFKKDGSLVENFPLELNDVFYTNAVFLGRNFFVLSEKAILYKISLDGNFITVQLPDTASAKDGIITAINEKGVEGIYVSGDNNILFAFDTNLELMYPYPLSGRGKPVFCDVDKDGKKDVITLSVSREINSWSVK